MRPINVASCAGLTGAASMPMSCAFSRRDTSPMTQLLASLGWPQAFAAASKYAAIALLCVSVVASYSGRP